MASKGLGTVKRFGARYGRRVRHKVAQIEAVRFAKKKCPYCHAWRVKRQAAGIWFCTKCDSKFTGKAYNITEKSLVKEEKKEEDHTEIKAFLEEKRIKAEERAALKAEQEKLAAQAAEHATLDEEAPQTEESEEALNNEESEK